MSQLENGFAFEHRARYTHMLALDVAVWERFLDQYDKEVLEVFYDVHVGQAKGAELDLSDAVRAVAEAVTRKRIDAVLRTSTGLIVVEVKPYGNYVALGQVQMYRRLFRAEFPEGRSATAMVVCYEVDPDVADDFALAGVKIWQVGTPF